MRKIIPLLIAAAAVSACTAPPPGTVPPGGPTLIARATQIVWICSPFSGATPAGSARSKVPGSMGLLAATSSAAGTAGALALGAGAGAASACCGAGAPACCWGPGGCAFCAYSIAAETMRDTASTNQRPRPLVGSFALTVSTVVPPAGGPGEFRDVCSPGRTVAIRRPNHTPVARAPRGPW